MHCVLWIPASSPYFIHVMKEKFVININGKEYQYAKKKFSKQGQYLAFQQSVCAMSIMYRLSLCCFLNIKTQQFNLMKLF